MTNATRPMENGLSGDTSASALDFAEVMTTRLCHDLAGMLGTVMGALELAGGDPALSGEAMSVAHEGAQQLANRLRLLRVAWGGADADEIRGERSVGLDALVQLAAGLPKGRRVTVRLDGLAADRAFTQASVRVLLNVLLLGVESLHGAGTVSLAGGPDGDVMVMIEGPRAAWPPGLAGMLANPAVALKQALAESEHRHVQGPLTALVALRARIGVTMLLGATSEVAPPLLISLD